ncbi:MAG: glycosyltransferase [Chthoniobacterales bacterium]
MTTTSDKDESFRLTVLNPGGRDQHQDFSLGQNTADDRAHAPVNFHAYAAATGGLFERDVEQAVAANQPVLLLLRGDFRETQNALSALKKAGLPVVVSLKETGLHQIAQQLENPKRAARFREIVQTADECLAATPEVVSFYGCGRFIPTPYPLHDSRWNFSKPVSEREGIFIGTREWDVPSRHHFAALILALGLDAPVTAFDDNPRRTRKTLEALGFSTSSLRLLERRLPYREYLIEMARHQIVLQADQSAVPGQVAGDALLCRLPCVGGNGAIDRIAFSSTCGHGRSLGELAELASRLLADSAFQAEIIQDSQARARERLSFETVARQLAEFFGSLSP